MSRARIALLTLLAMIAFAGNSLLCRAALKQSGIDAASFTSIRMLCGALTLWLLLRARGYRTSSSGSGNWPSACALFAYAACFSFAYIDLTAATGALLLFGAVQSSMIAWGIFRGERFGTWQIVGLCCALGGLLGLLLPGFAAPPIGSAMLMIAAGIAWGVYSLRGRGASDAAAVTAGNFMRTVPLALLLSLVSLEFARIDVAGAVYALASGAIASGLGYAIWYSALRGLRATTAATVQLSVPVIAAVGGILLLDEVLTFRLVIASIAVLGGIALVVFKKTLPVTQARKA